jgi:hypothetical protein
MVEATPESGSANQGHVTRKSTSYAQAMGQSANPVSFRFAVRRTASAAAEELMA